MPPPPTKAFIVNRSRDVGLAPSLFATVGSVTFSTVNAGVSAAEHRARLTAVGCCCRVGACGVGPVPQ